MLKQTILHTVCAACVTYILSTSDWFGDLGSEVNQEMIVVSSSSLRANMRRMLIPAEVIKKTMPYAKIDLIANGYNNKQNKLKQHLENSQNTQ